MQLKKNEMKIIQLLLASDNYISSYEIANSTGISRRRSASINLVPVK